MRGPKTGVNKPITSVAIILALGPHTGKKKHTT